MGDHSRRTSIINKCTEIPLVVQGMFGMCFNMTHFVHFLGNHEFKRDPGLMAPERSTDHLEFPLLQPPCEIR